MRSVAKIYVWLSQILFATEPYNYQATLVTMNNMYKQQQNLSRSSFDIKRSAFKNVIIMFTIWAIVISFCIVCVGFSLKAILFTAIMLLAFSLSSLRNYYLAKKNTRQ